jgi:hypothetical protein
MRLQAKARAVAWAVLSLDRSAGRQENYEDDQQRSCWRVRETDRKLPQDAEENRPSFENRIEERALERVLKFAK